MKRGLSKIKIDDKRFVDYIKDLSKKKKKKQKIVQLIQLTDKVNVTHESQSV